MREKKRHHLLPWLVAVAAGWFGGWLVDMLLAPKPLIEIALAPGEEAFLFMQHLSIGTRDQSGYHTQRVLRLDGKQVTVVDATTLNALEEIPQPVITQPTDRESLFGKQASQYLTFSPAPGLVQEGRYRYVTVDSTDMTKRRYHGFVEADHHLLIQGAIGRKVAYCLTKQSLPLDELLMQPVTFGQSPACLLANELLKVRSNTLVSVLTVPGKQLVTQFVLGRDWADAELALAADGKQVFCIRRSSEMMTEQMPYALSKAQSNKSVVRLWDAQLHRWVPTLPGLVRTSPVSEHAFITSDIVATALGYDASAVAFDAFSLIDMKNGACVDQLQGISAGFFQGQQVLKQPDGSFYYLVRDPSIFLGLSYQLKYCGNDKQSVTIAEKAWPTRSPGVVLTSGLQSIIDNDGHTDMSNWLDANWRNRPFYERLQNWFHSSRSLTVYDWRTGLSYTGWNTPFRWHTASDQNYLHVVKQRIDPLGQPRDMLSQIYALPLAIHSPYWKWLAGIMLTLITYFCIKRAQFLLARAHSRG